MPRVTPEEAIRQLWEQNHANTTFAPRRVSESVLSLNDRLRLKKLHHQSGGLNIDSVAQFRDILARVTGISLGLSDSEVRELLREHSRESPNPGRHPPFIDADGLVALAATLKKRVIMYDGAGDIPDPPPSPKHPVASSLETGVAKEKTPPPDLLNMSDVTAASTMGSPVKRGLMDESMASLDGHTAMSSYLTPSEMIRALPKGYSATPSGRIGRTESNRLGATFSGTLTDGTLRDMTLRDGELLLIDADTSRNPATCEIFAELGGDPLDPCSLVPASRVRVFVNSVLRSCGKSESFIQQYIDRFERLYNDLTIRDFESEVMDPLSTCVPRRLLDRSRRTARAGGNSSRRSTAANDMSADSIREASTFSVVDDAGHNAASFIAGRTLFSTVKKLQSHAHSAADLRRSLKAVDEQCTARDEIHSKMMMNADKVFSSRCNLEGSPIHHIVHLRAPELLRYVNRMNTRRRVIIGRTNVVIGRFARAVSMAAQLLIDHNARCTHCKEMRAIVERVEKGRCVTPERTARTRTPPRFGKAPTWSPATMRRLSNAKGNHLEPTATTMQQESAKCTSIAERVHRIYQQTHALQPPPTPPHGWRSARNRPSSTRQKREEGNRKTQLLCTNRFVRNVHARQMMENAAKEQAKYPDFRF